MKMSVSNSGGSPKKSVNDTGEIKITKKSTESSVVRPDWTNYVSSQTNNAMMCSVCVQRHCFKCEHRLTDEERIRYIIGDVNQKTVKKRSREIRPAQEITDAKAMNEQNGTDKDESKKKGCCACCCTIS